MTLQKKNTQIIRIKKSILDYYYMISDLDNESIDTRRIMMDEFKEKMNEAIDTGPGNKKISWI